MSKSDNTHERWGGFSDGSDLRSELQASDFISPKQKLEKLKLSNMTTKTTNENNQILTLDNPLVTQTVEVMNQTEFIQTLLDTYASDAQTSFLNQNEGIFMPHIDLTPDTTANLVSDEKFLKPLWYIPPHETAFTKGIPTTIPKISKPVVMEAIRSSLSGLVRLKEFNVCSKRSIRYDGPLQLLRLEQKFRNSTDSALQMFTDGVDEFYKCFMESINSVLINEGQDKNKTLSITTLEKAFAANNSSLTALHNYYKNEIIARNKSEIDEFKNVYQDYDKLMQENLNMQKTLNALKRAVKSLMKIIFFEWEVTHITRTTSRPPVMMVLSSGRRVLYEFFSQHKSTAKNVCASRHEVSVLNKAFPKYVYNNFGRFRYYDGLSLYVC